MKYILFPLRSFQLQYAFAGNMTLLSSILDSGGGISAQRLTRLLRQSSSISSSSSASADVAMLEPTSSQLPFSGERIPFLDDNATTSEAPLGDVLEQNFTLDRVTSVAKMALEATVKEVLRDPDPDLVLAGVNASAPWNATLASAAATNYENCSALFANYTLPQTGE